MAVRQLEDTDTADTSRFRLAWADFPHRRLDYLQNITKGFKSLAQTCPGLIDTESIISVGPAEYFELSTPGFGESYLQENLRNDLAGMEVDVLHEVPINIEFDMRNVTPQLADFLLKKRANEFEHAAVKTYLEKGCPSGFDKPTCWINVIRKNIMNSTKQDA